MALDLDAGNKGAAKEEATGGDKGYLSLEEYKAASVAGAKAVCIRANKI